VAKKPSGSVSATGIIAAGVLLVALGVWAGLAGPAMFSPGKLSAKATGVKLGGMTSHAQTGGSCDICHVEPWSSDDMATRCTRCHTDVATEIQTHEGVHGLLSRNASSPTCRGCHSEHLGADGALTVVDDSKFPHELTGYSLASHQHTIKGPAFTCKDCHGTDLSRFDQAICATCHSSIDAKFTASHKASFGANCLLCHKGSTPDGTDFDHDAFAFKLTGAHAGVACSGCHTPTRSRQALSLTPQTCYSCHAKDDKHRGSLGYKCNSCHATSTWSTATFNHSVLGSNVASKDCASCHADTDIHEGAFGRQCGQCHNTGGWSRALFSHSRLSGSLASADCASCHAGNDVHSGRFGRQCGQCHSTSSWGGSSAGHSAFPANHGGAQTCSTCHPSGTKTYTCYGCHEHTPANVQAEHGGRSVSSLANCLQCHSGGGGGGGHEGRGSGEHRGHGNDD